VRGDGNRRFAISSLKSIRKDGEVGGSAIPVQVRRGAHLLNDVACNKKAQKKEDG